MSGHKDRAHAVLSASGAHRWMACTPSAVIEAGLPDTTSEAAKEGTLAHEICEAKLRHYIDTTSFTKRKLTYAMKKFRENELYQSEMEGYTDAYVDTVKEIALAFEHAPSILVEQKLDLSFIIPDGFGTADCILISGEVLHIIDFKYGKGVPVSADHNPQMMIYALGAYERYKLLYPIRTVRTTIFQPRIDNCSTAEYNLDQLTAFAMQVEEKAALAIKGEGEQIPGDWCTFCRAKATCRARAQENVRLAGFTDKLPPLISNDEVGHYLELGADVAKWLKALQDYALAECLAGRAVAGWKAVEGRSVREWTDMDAAFEALKAAGTQEAMLYERKPITLAACEKLVGKKAFADTVGGFVKKRPGKPALVTESDKRPAITNQITAAEAFGEAEGIA